MVRFNDFRTWLENNTGYSKRTISNTVSRLRRADSMLPWFEDEVYIFRLEQSEPYKTLSVIVRSQIKKAVKLYFEFIKNSKQLEEGK